MKLAFSDLETFWSTEHTLTRMSPVAYCMHPDTELISWSIKIGNAPTDVIFGEKEIKRVAAKMDWSDKMVVAHNGSAFDHMIHAWRMNMKPRMWGCTLAMARPIHAKTVGLSLAKLVAHYGIGVKQDAVLHQTRGRHLCDFTPAEIAAMEVYNKEDTEQCAKLFFELAKHYTPAELWHLDCNIRMLVEPEFELDTGLLETAASVERSNKHRALLDLARHLRKDWGAAEGLLPLDWGDEEAVAEFTRAQMASAPKFSEVLASRGVDVPMKWSKTDKTKKIPAIAKTDEAMEELLEHEDEVVACAARARLSAKSTQLETRIASFLATNAAVGKLPVPAHYCGADTTGRDSGFMYNMLNLPRINPDKPKVSDALRNSVRAPAGQVIFVADLSGIELRVNHTLWKVKRSMDMWAAKPDADLYKATAARMYEVPVDEVTKSQRHLAKVIELAAGFQQGGKTFRQTARIQGGLRLTLAESTKAINDWRGLYPEISDPKTGGWAQCHDALNYIARGDKVPIDDWGLCTTEKDAIVLPSGRRIRYPDLREEWVDDWKEVDGLMVASKKKAWVYGQGRHYSFIYGGKVDENCLAGHSLILTDSGWKCLDDVGVTDLVHDGVEFVRHGGTVYRGVQSTIVVDGVYMTPDHEVLTNEGWQPALEKPRPWRPGLRGADSDAPGWKRRQEDELEVPLHVRGAVCEGGERRNQRGEARGGTQLRVHVRGPSSSQELNARDVEAPGVRGVGLDESAVWAPDARRLGELRGAGDRSVPGLGGLVRGVLERHARGVRLGSATGQGGQRQGVLPRKLPVGDSEHEHVQHAGVGASWRGGDSGSHGHRQVDAVLPAQAGATTHAVYDILNCGPRRRFVVLGDDGPFVVHNCVQALARDVIFPNALEFWKRTGLRPKHKVYDELVYLASPKDAPALLDTLQGIMRKPPPWWPSLVLWSEGDTAQSYGAAK